MPSRTIALENGEIDVLLNVGTNDAQKIREMCIRDRYKSEQGKGQPVFEKMQLFYIPVPVSEASFSQSTHTE